MFRGLVWRTAQAIYCFSILCIMRSALYCFIVEHSQGQDLKKKIGHTDGKLRELSDQVIVHGGIAAMQSHAGTVITFDWCCTRV